MIPHAIIAHYSAQNSLPNVEEGADTQSELVVKRRKKTSGHTIMQRSEDPSIAFSTHDSHPLSTHTCSTSR